MKPNQNKSAIKKTTENLTPEQKMNRANNFLKKPQAIKKNLKNLKDLDWEKPYQIYGWERINIKKPVVRTSILFDLGEFLLWGNKKCSEMPDEMLNDFVSEKMKLVYYGQQDPENKLSEHMIEFTL